MLTQYIFNIQQRTTQTKPSRESGWVGKYDNVGCLDVNL